MRKLLLLEDDPLIAKSLCMSLSYQNFTVTHCSSVAQAKDVFAREKFDLLILDVNLPDGSGLDFCRFVRKTEVDTPALVLTAKVDEDSAVQAMTGGADDFVRKPFGIHELIARLNRLLERRKQQKNILSYGCLKIDVDQHLAWAGSEVLQLGKKEFAILSLLIRNQGDVATREAIISALGDEASDIYDRTVDSHLSHLRRKLKNCGANDVHIVPVYGIGYRMEIK